MWGDLTPGTLDLVQKIPHVVTRSDIPVYDSPHAPLSSLVAVVVCMRVWVCGCVHVWVCAARARVHVSVTCARVFQEL